jgi:hypothetical protein
VSQPCRANDSPNSPAKALKMPAKMADSGGSRTAGGLWARTHRLFAAAAEGYVRVDFLPYCNKSKIWPRTPAQRPFPAVSTDPIPADSCGRPTCPRTHRLFPAAAEGCVRVDFLIDFDWHAPDPDCRRAVPRNARTRVDFFATAAEGCARLCEELYCRRR